MNSIATILLFDIHNGKTCRNLIIILYGHQNYECVPKMRSMPSGWS